MGVLAYTFHPLLYSVGKIKTDFVESTHTPQNLQSLNNICHLWSILTYEARLNGCLYLHRSWEMWLLSCQTITSYTQTLYQRKACEVCACQTTSLWESQTTGTVKKFSKYILNTYFLILFIFKKVDAWFFSVAVAYVI